MTCSVTDGVRRLACGASLLFVLLLSGAAQAQVVQGCASTDFVDLRAADLTARTLTWDFSILTDARKCMLVQAGQSVVWGNTNLDAHPLGPQGGDLPTPIGTYRDGESVAVLFNAPGTFGYRCLAHSSMIGAVKVVAAPVAPLPAAQAPALSHLLAGALGILLVALGTFFAQRRRQRRAAA